MSCPAHIVFMNISIQTINVMKDRNINDAHISLRLTDSIAIRYWHIMDAAKERNPYARKTDVVRELFGLNPPDLLTPEEIEFFRNGEKARSEGSELVSAPETETIRVKSQSHGVLSDEKQSGANARKSKIG